MVDLCMQVEEVFGRGGGPAVPHRRRAVRADPGHEARAGHTQRTALRHPPHLPAPAPGTVRADRPAALRDPARHLPRRAAPDPAQADAVEAPPRARRARPPEALLAGEIPRGYNDRRRADPRAGRPPAPRSCRLGRRPRLAVPADARHGAARLFFFSSSWLSFLLVFHRSAIPRRGAYPGRPLPASGYFSSRRRGWSGRQPTEPPPAPDAGSSTPRPRAASPRRRCAPTSSAAARRSPL